MKSITNFMRIIMLFSASLLLHNCQSLSDVIAVGNSANDQMKDLTDPTEAQDAATKAYVDMIKKQIHSQIAGGAVGDVDGNVYNTVKICDQIWMAENLRTTKYNDGTDIDISEYHWYNDDEETYKNIYGGLYDYINFEKICPSGWHVPSTREWVDLIECVDEFTGIEGGYPLEGESSGAGGKLKEEGILHWKSPNTGATDAVGFTALSAGKYQGYIANQADAMFSGMDETAYFWCFPQSPGAEPQVYVFFKYNSSKCKTYVVIEWSEMYLSIRCIKD